MDLCRVDAAHGIATLDAGPRDGDSHMKRALLATWLFLSACQATPGIAQAPSCSLPEATVLEQSGDPQGANGRLLQVWEIADDPALWLAGDPLSEGYRDFRNKVAAKGIETDPVALLKASPSAGSDKANNELVIARAADWIRPAGCLERFLVGYQHARVDTFVAPTEFMAMVLRSADGARLRIYFYTINQDGIGRVGPVSEPALVDVAQGWRVMIGMHTHVFHPGQPLLDGIVAPSVPDADFNANFAVSGGMQEAWITNGVHTVRIPAAAFGLFKRD